MGRGPVQRGNSVAISTVAGTSPKPYPLALVEGNYSYETVSDQPEAQPNQPLSVLLSFHGGLAYGKYNERTAGVMLEAGILANEPNVLRAPIAPTTVTLTDAAAPPMYFFEAEATNATVTFDAKGTGKADNNTVVTWSHTIGSDSDRYLLVGLARSGTGNATTVTLGSQSLTSLGARSTGNDYAVEMWGLVNPTSGAGTITATYAVSRDRVGHSTSWENVHQATSVGSAASGAGTTAGPLTVAAATDVGDEAVDMAVANAQALTVDGSQDEHQNDSQDTVYAGMSSETATGASTTMSWTIGGSTNWAIITVPLKAANAPLLYVESVEPGETNIYKISINDANFGTLLNTRTFSQVTTPPQGRPAEWNNGTNTYWTLGLGDNGKIQQLTAIASSTSNDTWTASGDADARHLFVVGNQLYRTTGANEVCVLARGSDPMTEANWGDEFYMGDAGTNITDIGEVAGISHLAKMNGFYEWDGVEGSGLNVLPEIGRAPRNGQGMLFWHGGFMIPAAQLWWTRTGTPIGPDSNPENTANDPSKGSTTYFKHGRWNGLAEFGAYLYGLYVSSDGSNSYLAWGRERHSGDPPGWGPLVWHSLDLASGDFNDFHGIFVTETSKFSATETRPCLWFANGNDVSYIWLDNDGAPMAKRGEIDLATAGSITSGRIDFGMPRVPKQLRVADGWAEDFGSVSGKFETKVYLDGGSVVEIGSDITADGYKEQFWTQDTSDTCRSLLFEVVWTGTSSLTDTNGPHLRDFVLRALAKPDTTNVWTFLFAAEEGTSRTGKLIKDELEAYKNVLKKYKLPDEESFNGVMTGIRLLRADEIRDLKPRGQNPPKYVLAATIRELISS